MFNIFRRKKSISFYKPICNPVKPFFYRSILFSYKTVGVTIKISNYRSNFKELTHKLTTFPLLLPDTQRLKYLISRLPEIINSPRTIIFSEKRLLQFKTNFGNFAYSQIIKNLFFGFKRKKNLNVEKLFYSVNKFSSSIASESDLLK